MPGIAGIITDEADERAAVSQLSQMLRLMRHDASSVDGTYCAPEAGAYVGWIGLPGGISDVNPVVSARDGIALILCGELFSDDGRPDPDGLLMAAAADPDGFVGNLNGWFAGALIDRRQRTLRLFNDRYGMRRVYYHSAPASFVFASEAKSVLAVRPAVRGLDPESLGHFLGYGTVFGNRTLFANLSLLPGASNWRITGPASIARRQYFDPSAWEAQTPLPAEDFRIGLADRLRQVLPRYFVSDPAVGLSLTGGLDTRIVVAGLPADGAPRPCYTYGGPYRDCYDVHVARAVAAICGLRHSVLPLGFDFFDNFRQHAERTVWVTDGCMDITGAHEVYFSTLARRYSPVRLTGNYGSEVLRSVSTFKYFPVSASLLSPDMAPSLLTAQELHRQVRRIHPVTFAAFAEIPWHLAGRRMAAESILVVRAPYLDNDLVPFLYRAPQGERETTQASLRAISTLNPALAGIPTDMGHGGNRNRALAAAVRLRRYAEFKAEWYYNLGMPDWLVPYEHLVPIGLLKPLFLGKHKIEHYRVWFRDRLRAPILDILSDAASRQRPYLERAGLRALIDDVAGNRRNSVWDVSRLATLELVEQLLVSRHVY